jgi:hypothetical protein
MVSVAVLGVAALIFFTWADWYTFAQDQEAHHEAAHFWSVQFLANWGDNAAQNWHSELLFGVLVVVLLKGARRGSEEDVEEQA